ncbi:MAG: hypothetical protein ACRD8O_02280 [Bryobacteraceae bacterium]
MPRMLSLFLMLAMAALAEQKTTAKKPVPAPRPLAIPAGAKEVDAGTYTYTDAKGKKWIYRKTPFGVSRFEDKPGVASVTPEPKLEEQIRAVEEGDVVKFERSGPFGAYKWERKKSELTEVEKAALERSRKKE